MTGVNAMLNDRQPVQNAVEYTQMVEIPCFTGLPREDLTPLDFRIERTDLYLDPSQVYLHLKCEIGSAQDDDETASCVNNLAYSMWQNVEMYINDQKISTDQTQYPWMAYVVCLTSFSKQYRDTAMTAAMWYPDAYGTMDTARGDNSGNTKRQYAIANAFELYSKVITDAPNLTRYLPNQTEIMYRFIPNPATFYLMGTQQRKMKILEARMYVAKVKLKIPTPLPYVCPAVKLHCRTRMANVGEQNLDWAAFVGRRPRRLFIMQVDQSAYNADLKLNPFNLQTFGVNRIQVYFNGLSLPCNSATPTADVARCFVNTIKAVDNSAAWDISIDAYKDGYFIYAVDMTADQSANHDDYRDEEETGTVRIIMDYGKPLTKAVAIICVAEFDDVLNIDVGGNPAWS